MTNPRPAEVVQRVKEARWGTEVGPWSSGTRWERNRRTEKEASLVELPATPAHVAYQCDRRHWAFPVWLQYLNERVTEVLLRPTSAFLMVELPTRHGKSVAVSRWTPLWFLGMFPHHHWLQVTYSLDLARKWGAEARDIMKDHGPRLFGLQVAPGYSLAQNWRVMVPVDQETRDKQLWLPDGGGGWELGGGMRSIPRGGSITGGDAHVICLAAGAMVETPTGPTPIEDLAASGGDVLCFDHDTDRITSRPIVASAVTPSDDIWEITTDEGRILSCTGDHRIFVEGAGYIEARLVEVGAQVRTMGDPSLRDVWGGCDAAGLRGGEEGSERPDGDVLRHRVLVGRGSSCGLDEEPALREVRTVDRQSESEVLSRVHLDPARGDQTEGPGRGGVLCVRRQFHTEERPAEVLLSAVRGPRPLGPDDRRRQLELQDGRELRTVVQVDETACPGTGRAEVHRLPEHDETSRSPLRRGREEQLPGEPGDALQAMPHRPSQVGRDTVAMVRRLRGESQPVYDLTVAGAHNFFAQQVLVHNCLDDPIKDEKEADSKRARDALWGFFTRRLRNRLEPPGPGSGKIMLVMSRWSPDDIAARLQDRMREDPDSDQWEVVHLKAIAEPTRAEFEEAKDTLTDEEFAIWMDEWVDPIGRKRGESMWPERYSEADLRQIKASVGPRSWASNFQQEPTDETGGMFPKGAWKFIPEDQLPAVARLEFVRRWDLAGSESSTADWTAGGLVSMDIEGNVYINDVRRDRLRPDKKRAFARNTAIEDEARYGQGKVRHVLEKEPGSSGIDVSDQWLREVFNGHNARALSTTGKKELLAEPLSAQVLAGNVFIVQRRREDGNWTSPLWYVDFADEAEGFGSGGSENDDMIDVVTKAYLDLLKMWEARKKKKSRVTSVAGRTIG